MRPIGLPSPAPPRRPPECPISSSITREGMPASSSQVAKVWRRSWGRAGPGGLGPRRRRRPRPGRPGAGCGSTAGFGRRGDAVAAARTREHQLVGPSAGGELAADGQPDLFAYRHHANAGRALGFGLEAAAEPAGLIADLDDLDAPQLREDAAAAQPEQLATAQPRADLGEEVVTVEGAAGGQKAAELLRGEGPPPLVAEDPVRIDPRPGSLHVTDGVGRDQAFAAGRFQDAQQDGPARHHPAVAELALQLVLPAQHDRGGDLAELPAAKGGTQVAPQVTFCGLHALGAAPWAGGPELPPVVGPIRRTGCGPGACPFTARRRPDEGLPVVVVDEEVYRLLPALLIGTVDKFAQMPWQGPTMALFGRVSGRCQRHGFRSPDLEDSDSHPRRGALPVARTVPAGPLRPPDLIIQDELHLIAGPLGSLVGLYETAIDRLCTWEADGRPVRPKVVASTATVRRAGHQVHRLFLRQVKVFPPPGLDAEDSFFAVQRPIGEVAGRRYLGLCAHGRRFKHVLI